MKLRIVFSQEDSRIWNIQDIPSTIECFKEALRAEYSINGIFRLQYLDNDFKEFVNLEDMAEVVNLTTIKVVQDATPPETDDAFVGTTCQEEVPGNSPLRVNRGVWPHPFPLPEFDVDIDTYLNKMDGTTTLVPKDIKSRMLYALASSISKLKPYPTSSEIASVATVLVTKYPNIRDKAGKGHESWANSISYKMNSYRGELRKLGAKEVALNGKRKSKSNPDGLPAAKCIKKARRGEVNFLPDYPALEDNVSLGIHQQWIAAEMEKGRPNEGEISRRMAKTFAMRREEILNEPALGTFLERWPAISMPSQIQADFIRLTNVNLTSTFYENLDEMSDRLLAMMKSLKQGKVARAVEAELRKAPEDAPETTIKRTLVLKALPLFLGENGNALYVEHTEDADIDTTTEGQASPHVAIIGDVFQTPKLYIVAEGNILVLEVDDFPKAVCLLLGLIYNLNLQYPARYTYKFLQKLVMQIDCSKMSPKIKSLQIKLVE